MPQIHTFLFLSLLLVAGNYPNESNVPEIKNTLYFSEDQLIHATEQKHRSIHIFVALCDNEFQGIVPVPAKIGNGQDPQNNLYWGCGFGIKTFFKKSSEWKLIRTQKKDSVILERLVFKHNSKDVYLVADAYNGKNIENCTIDFLKSCSGVKKDTIQIEGKIIGISGHSDLLAYTGHDGLMDFQLENEFSNVDGIKRNVIILACYSKHFFAR